MAAGRTGLSRLNPLLQPSPSLIPTTIMPTPPTLPSFIPFLPRPGTPFSAGSPISAKATNTDLTSTTFINIMAHTYPGLTPTTPPFQVKNSLTRRDALPTVRAPLMAGDPTNFASCHCQLGNSEPTLFNLVATTDAVLPPSRTSSRPSSPKKTALPPYSTAASP